MRHNFIVLPVKKWLKSVHIYGSYRKIKPHTRYTVQDEDGPTHIARLPLALNALAIESLRSSPLVALQRHLMNFSNSSTSCPSNGESGTNCLLDI